MRLDLERALSDVVGAASGASRPVDLDRALRRVHRRRAVVATGTSVAGVGAAGAVALAATNLPLGAPQAPATRPTSTSVTASPSATAVAAEPLPGWEPGPAPCGTPFDLEPVDGPRVELTGRATHGSPDDNDVFTPGLGEDWIQVQVDVGPDTPGEVLDHPGAPDMSLHTVLVDAAGEVAFVAEQLTDVREYKDGSGSNIAQVWDSVDCRTGRPLDGEFRVFSVFGPGQDPHVSGDLGPRGEVTELAPVRFGVGDEQAWTWDSSFEWAPREGETLTEALARGPEPELVVDVDEDSVVVSDAAITASAVLRTEDGELSGVVPQHLRAVLVADDGSIVQGVGLESFPSARRFDLAPGEPGVEVEVHQWNGSAFASSAGLVVPGATFDLYVWDVVPAAGPDGATEDRVALSEPVRVTVVESSGENAP